MLYAVECINVSKKFKDVEAIKSISFNIEKNKIYGFLGRNGAGKSTMLNLISTRILSNEGEIKVFEQEAYENEEILNKICFIKDRMTYMTNFKIKDIFKTASYFFENWDEEFKEELVQKFQLDVNKKYRGLSKGMESMVGIIIGLASRAPLTIFDEAYLGLDAAARQLFYDILLKDYTEKPRTIIFSTHLIDEVSNIFENIIILHKGEVLLQDNMDNVRDKSFSITGNKEKLEDIIKNKNILSKETFGNLEKAYLYENINEEEIKNIKIEGFDIKPISLQELFIQMTSK